MNTHKKVVFVWVLTCLIVGTRLAQRKMSEAIYTDSTILVFNNNFIQDKSKIRYQPYEIKTPFRDLYFDIYGKQFKISVYKNSELINNGGVITSGSYKVSAKQDAALFDLSGLEYAIITKGTTEAAWQKVTSKPFIDTLIDDFYKGKTHYRRGYSLYDDTLAEGDSLTIEFRQENAKPFLKVHFVKRSALESPPQLMGSSDNHDKEYPLEQFIQSALERYKSWNKSFYDDWPGHTDNSNTKLFPDTKTAYYFNPRSSAQNDSAFEYRLIVNGNVPTRWTKSNNIIFISGLQAGKQYKLEVRQRNKPQYVFAKRFYVPGYWYQTAWFKIGLTLFLISTGFAIFLLLKNKQQKRTRQEQQNKLKTLYTQLNPHFVFNAMGSIQGLLNEGELEKANKYLSGFGSLLRSTLNSSEKDTITLQEELNHLNTYISLEQLRRPFTYTQNIDPNIVLSEIPMLPLFLQPIVENAIKHGHKANGETLHLSITLARQVDDLNITITDDGKGFDTQTIHQGKGLAITDERMKYFNRSTKKKKIIKDISSSKEGTTVHIKFINWLQHD